MGVQGGLNMCCAWPDPCCLSEAAVYAGGMKSSHQGWRKSENQTKTEEVASDKNIENSPISPPSDQDGFYLFIHLSLFTKSKSSELLHETNGNVVDLLLEEHGEGVRLPTALGRTVSNEESAVLQQKTNKTVANPRKFERQSINFLKKISRETKFRVFLT